MGLDQYLEKKTYVKNWDYMTPDEKYKITIKKGGKKTNIKPERITGITEEVMYWRKANAIHGWFVKNVQGGKDDGNDYFVSKEKMEELISTIKLIQKNKQLAPKLLPTTMGFFFGGEEYDDYYFEYIDETKKVFEKLLEENGKFYYSANW